MNRLALATLLTVTVAFVLFAYMVTEGIGIFGGLWWHVEKNEWTLTRAGGRVLAGTHPTGQTRPHALTIKNLGRRPLVMPYLAATDANPWKSFDVQVHEAVAEATSEADRAAMVVDWIRRRVQPETTGMKAQLIDNRPWVITYVLGFGDCDDLSFLMFLAVRSLKMPARIVNLRGHTVVEVQYDDCWHVFDPAYGYAFYDDDGNVPSYSEVAAAGGNSAWRQADRPWAFAAVTAPVWQREPEILPHDIPPDWWAVPAPLVLASGDSIRFKRLRHRELFGGLSGKDAFVSLVELDLAVPPAKYEWTLPFPVLRAEIVPGDGGLRRVLLDRYALPNELVFGFAERPAEPWPQGTRIRVQALAASSWIPTPRPGFTALKADWMTGERAHFTLEWERR